MNKLNTNTLVDAIQNAKKYVKGELELDCIDGVWTAMDYREELGGAFQIKTSGFNDKIISVAEARACGIDVKKCCDICGVAYVG